jgi:8-oxo-dGTP pyrophosphatase MutT (NUDIX family)
VKSAKETSAGGVVYRRLEAEEAAPATGDLEIVLASRRTRAGRLAWGLPKGIIDPGEEAEQAALREVREETGLTAKIEDSLGTLSYFYVWEGTRISKLVHFFLMRATGGNTDDHDDEMEEVRWFPANTAIRRASYPSERNMIQKAVDQLT